MLAKALVVDDEVQRHREGVDEKAAQARFLPMQERVADEAVVEREGAEMGLKGSERGAFSTADSSRGAERRANLSTP